MAIRAADLTILAGLLLLTGAGIASAAERATRPARLSGRDRHPGRRRRCPDPLRHGFLAKGRSAGVHARRSLSRGDRPAAGDVQPAAQDRRNRPRPGQGVPLRPRHAGRLAHRDGRRQAGADRQGLRDRRRGRPAGPPGGRSRRDRPRQLHEDARRRKPAGAGRDAAAPWSANPRTRAIRGRSSCSIPATAASTTARSRASGEMEKDIVLQFAMLLRDELERSGKYRVVMTRTDDTFIPLVDRVRMARIRQAALFVSIHADAHQEGRGRGPGRHRSTRCRRPPPTPRRAGLPKARTAPT